MMTLYYLDYNRDRAFKELKDFCGFQYHGRKRLENYLTAFAQLCWFPEKFGVGKRTSRLSSMIVSGQLTREEALKELEEPLYEEDFMVKCKEKICQNLAISKQDLESLIKFPELRHCGVKVIGTLLNSNAIYLRTDLCFIKIPADTRSAGIFVLYCPKAGSSLLFSAAAKDRSEESIRQSYYSLE